MMMKNTTAIALLMTLSLLACETDSYNKGQGRYSLLQADMADMTIGGDKQATDFTTDDGATYRLSTPYKAQWIARPDTVYRSIVYYNKVDDGRASIQSAAAMTVVHPVPHWRFKQLPQDPLQLESAWVARSGKYLNLALLVKSGYVNDEEPRHAIGLAQDTLIAYPSGRRAAYYRLLHSQGDSPEYYTARRYVSIVLPAAAPDTVILTVPTASGSIVRRFEK